MMPIPWRAVGLGAAIVAAFLCGMSIEKGRCERRALALVAAQNAVVAEQQARNVKALQDQLSVNQAIGAENAKLQSANADADIRLRGLLRAFAAKSGGNPLPGAPPSASGTAATGQESGCTQHIGDLLERVADLASAARSDSAELSLLQQWSRESGLMN